MRYLITLILFCLITTAATSQTDWQLKKSEDNIQVYNRSVEGDKLKAIRVTCTIDGTLSQLTALLFDAKAHERWVYGTANSHIVEQLSPNKQVYYSELKLPWPLANRDVVVLMTIEQDPVTKILKVKANNIESSISSKEGIIRIPFTSVTWHVTPLDSNRIKIEYVAQADPGGGIPAWIVNMFSTKGPLETFKNLKQLIKSNAYSNARYSFVKN